MGLLEISFIGLCAAVLGGWFVLWRRGTALYPVHRSLAARLLAILGVLWVGSLGLAASGILARTELRPPPMLLLVLASTTVMVAMAAAPRFKRPFNHAPLVVLVGLQWFRLPLEMILWQLANDGRLPQRMTFEGYNWDIVFGITALPLAFLIHKWPRTMRVVAIVWNLLGIAMVLNIATLGFLSAPGPQQYFMDEPANRIVTQVPFVLLIVFLVPTALLLHVYSLQQLKRGRRVWRWRLWQQQ